MSEDLILGNGKIATQSDQQDIINGCCDPNTGRIDLTSAVAALVYYFSTPPNQVLFQATEPEKGYWRYWTGTHWALYIESLLYRDIHWLLDKLLLARQVKEIVSTLKHRLCVPNDHFDQKPIVVFNNCVLTVENNTIKQYQPGFLPEDYITVNVPITYQPKETPYWDAIISQLLPDEEDRKTLQEMFGYCFFPSVQLQTFFALVGNAGTGKSTIIEVLCDMLGRDRVTNVKLDSIREGHNLAGLMGSLVNIDNEAEYLDPKAEGVLKSITGGDPLHINPKYMKAFQVKLPTKFVLVSNEMPRFSDRSDGTWSRLVQIPFLHPVPEHQRKQTSQIIDQLRPEYPGILQWGLKGLARALKKGTRASAFTQSQTAKQQIHQHKKESNSFLDWFEETIDHSDPNAILVKQTAYDHYRNWCKRNGRTSILMLATFGQQMTKQGISTSKPHRGARGYKGVQISTCEHGVSCGSFCHPCGGYATPATYPEETGETSKEPNTGEPKILRLPQQN